MERNITLFVISEDEILLRTVEDAAPENGLEPRGLKSVSQALEAAGEEEVGVAVVDLDLPDGGGWSACEELRRLYFRKPLQILLCSAHRDGDFVAAALEAGGDDFLGKPVDELEMRVRLRAAVIRLRHHADLHHEREFYRRAVKQEEELSSRVLDQNLQLRKAYEEVAGLNRELERAKEELERIARYDMLSGLMNRMSLFEALDVEIERCLRSSTPLCGIMMDIDHFKTVNDNYGHGCGDKIIRALGGVLREELRKYDYAGRYGGEEFFIALPNSSLNQASMFAERLRSRLVGMSILCEEDAVSALVSVTVSMGIARFRPGESRDMWMSRADRAMYVAKQKGRNRVEAEPG
ncbi:MAG: diguanylate cyclase [Spirochaetaceae bacterium]